MVMTLLEENLGLRVRRDQITVVQSRLSAEEMDRVLGRSPPIASTDVSEAFVSRLTLADLHIVDEMGGKKEVGVRIVGGTNSFDGRRQAAGGDGALLRPIAEAALDAVSGLMQRAGRPVALFLKEVRRFRRRGDQGVVVLVEATADGRKTLMSGAAFSAESFERTSVVAVLQATNAFVAGTLEFPRNGEENSEADPPPPRTGGFASLATGPHPDRFSRSSQPILRLEIRTLEAIGFSKTVRLAKSIRRAKAGALVGTTGSGRLCG
jgi:hypothetical protein